MKVLWLAFGVLVAAPSIGIAQVRDTLAGTRLSRPLRDSTAKDTAVKWAPADSVMGALLKRQGVTVTRYQGGVVTFDANNKALAIGLSSTVGSEAWNSRDLKSRPH